MGSGKALAERVLPVPDNRQLSMLAEWVTLFCPWLGEQFIRRVGQCVGQGENSPLKNCAAVIKDYWSQSSARKPYSEPTIITRSAAEYKLLTWCHCPFGRWLFLCRRKNFQNRLFKTQFSVGLNRRTFEEASGEAEVNILWTFVKRGLKSAFLLPTTWGDFFGGTRTGSVGSEM